MGGQAQDLKYNFFLFYVNKFFFGKVHPFASLGGEAQDLKYNGEVPRRYLDS